MTIEPTELTVDPGSEVTTTVTVRNLGTRVEEFQLMPRGPAAAFAAITPSTLSIYPDDEQQAVVRFAPLRDPQSPAGVAPFDIMAHSAIHTDVSDVARGQLTVTPFQELSAVLTPEISHGRTPARHQVSVTNGGNTPVNTQLAFRDQDGALTFRPPSGAATLRPGATADFPFRINGPHRWFGRTTRLPFSAVVTPAGPQPPITLNGTRQQTAVFPWWIPTAAVAVVAIAIALFAVWPKPSTPRVPVIGLVDQATAVQRLTDAQYIPEVIPAGDDTVLAGLAARTDPAGGAELPHGEHVKLYISTGKCPDGPCPVEVPNVEGLSASEAQSKLQDKKFAVRIIRVASADRPADQVIASDPKARTPLPPGSDVVLTVSSGPQGSSSSPQPPQQPPQQQPPQQQPLQPPPPQPPPPQPPPPQPPPQPPPPPPPPSPPPPVRTCPPTSSADQPTDAGLEIASPGEGAWLKEVNESYGTARLASGEHLWLLLCAPGIHYFYFVSETHRETPVSNDTWKERIYLNPNEHGDFFLYAVVVNAEDSQRLDKSSADEGFVTELPHSARYVRVTVHCCS